MTFLNNTIKNIISERKNGKNKDVGDLLDLMLNARDEENNPILTDSELVGEIMTFIVSIIVEFLLY